MRMPFGRYKGWVVDDLPTDYLSWLSDISLRDPSLRSAVMNELRTRGRSGAHARRTNGHAPNPAVVDQLVSASVRTLAKVHHPDCGGDTAMMQKINVAADWLRSQPRRRK